MKIAVGSDHGGFELKETLKQVLVRKGIEVEDLGCHNRESTDYPDYAREVSGRIVAGQADQGLLVCTTGIGMSMAANKIPGIRAALCMTEEMAAKARTHNDANVLVLGEKTVSAGLAESILGAWLENRFDGGGASRHARRVRKINELDDIVFCRKDPEIRAALQAEVVRQKTTIDLIASENYASATVREIQGSVLGNKYAEGYPRHRWYNGCMNVDDVEQIALDRAKQVFGADHANVQPHCGSSANMAVYFSVLQPGDSILAMDLAHGGHLTHGHSGNFSGRLFNFHSYGVERGTEQIDYKKLLDHARACRPRMIVAGASAYPRTLDFARFREAADSVGAYLLVDMAHIAGLIAAGCHPSPVPFADFITTTTHKTLRGPRGGMILCRQAFADKIDHEIFPGIQGGPAMHTIAAKAVCLGEALQPEFKAYGKQIVQNAAALAEVLLSRGFRLVSGGTENHLMLVDLSPKAITGKDAANALEKAGIVLNKNTIPFDAKSPFVTSGIRIGTPAMTTRGMKVPEAKALAGMIADILGHMGDEAVARKVRDEVVALAAAFPVP